MGQAIQFFHEILVQTTCTTLFYDTFDNLKISKSNSFCENFAS